MAPRSTASGMTGGTARGFTSIGECRQMAGTARSGGPRAARGGHRGAVWLEAGGKGCPPLVCPHRLATTRHATRILVFDQGRVIESGNFEELVALGGTFAGLAKAQFMTGTDGAPAPKPLVET